VHVTEENVGDARRKGMEKCMKIAKQMRLSMTCTSAVQTKEMVELEKHKCRK
jgi:hypothetical protein